MLRIRLQRTGRENKPFYRIVVAEHSAPVKAQYIDRLGFYNPIANPRVFEMDQEKMKSWIAKGAQPSSTIARLLKGNGMEGMDRYIVPMVDRKKKKEAATEAAAPAAAEPAVADSEKKS